MACIDCTRNDVDGDCIHEALALAAAAKPCSCGMKDLKRPCKLTCDRNKISRDCDICRRPLNEHLKDGTHPPAWMWDRITDLEKTLGMQELLAKGAEEKLTKYTQQYTEELQLAVKVNEEVEQKLKDARRHVQEHIDDKHRILREYDEKVKELKSFNAALEVRINTLKEMLAAEKSTRKHDRQVIIEHTDAVAVVKFVFGLDKTDPLDDQLFEIACQRVMAAVKHLRPIPTPGMRHVDDGQGWRLDVGTDE